MVKTEVKRPLSRPGRKWESNSEVNFTEIGRGWGARTGFNWHGKGTNGDALANTVMNSRAQ